jgi:hypothetical protein
MRDVCCAVTGLILLHLSFVNAAQQPSGDQFGKFRAIILERVRDNGVPPRQALARVFSLPADMRVVPAAEVVLPDKHRFSLTLSINSTDVFLMESRDTAGNVVVTVFHTDLNGALRGAASGATVDSLELLPDVDAMTNQFQEVLATWQRALPQMMEARRPQP